MSSSVGGGRIIERIKDADSEPSMGSDFGSTSKGLSRQNYILIERIYFPPRSTKEEMLSTTHHINLISHC
jgi:hypothetical protein